MVLVRGLLLASSLALMAVTCLGHADYMLKSQYCPSGSSPRVMISGKTGPHGRTASTTSTPVTVKRGNAAVTSGSSYVAGELLTVSLAAPSGNDYLIETSGGATFGGRNAGCGGKRVANSQATLTMPSSGDVMIWAGMINGQTGIKVTPTFILKAPAAATASTTKKATPKPKYLRGLPEEETDNDEEEEEQQP